MNNNIPQIPYIPQSVLVIHHQAIPASQIEKIEYDATWKLVKKDINYLLRLCNDSPTRKMALASEILNTLKQDNDLKNNL